MLPSSIFQDTSHVFRAGVRGASISVLTTKKRAGEEEDVKERKKPRTDAGQFRTLVFEEEQEEEEDEKGETSVVMKTVLAKESVRIEEEVDQEKKPGDIVENKTKRRRKMTIGLDEEPQTDK